MNPFAFVIHSFSVWTAQDCAIGHKAQQFAVTSGRFALAAERRTGLDPERLSFPISQPCSFP
jgi:hypothetical protein